MVAKRSIEARINDAKRESTDIPETIDELEKYAEDTALTILYPTLQAGGIESTAADHAGSHMLKSMVHSVKKGASGSREGLRDTIFEMASVASVHLQKARELAQKDALPVLRQAIPAQVLLNLLSRVHFDVFDSMLHLGVLRIPPLWFQMKLIRHIDGDSNLLM